MFFAVRYGVTAALSRSRELARLAGNRMASSSSSSLADRRRVVPKDEVVRFVEDCMRKAGSTQEDARTVAHHLMIADYRGHFSHGMNRLKLYVEDIENRITDPAAKPRIVTDFQVRRPFFPLSPLFFPSPPL